MGAQDIREQVSKDNGGGFLFGEQDAARDSMDTPRERRRDAEHAVERLLVAVGEDPQREGLRDTPKRVAKAHMELTSGYGVDPGDVMTTFDSGGYDEMVLLTDIPFFSLCEHHMLPFAGKAHVGYVPGDRIVGLSKIARLVDVYARRLQVQERLTAQVADALTEHLRPAGAICVIEAEHYCMAMRGIQRPGATTTTSALRGNFQEDSKTRAEALSLIDSQKKRR